jgi:hypothetical protein
MRVYLFLAVLGLMIVEALLLPRTVKDFRMMRQMRAQAASEALLPTSLTPFAGYDVEGRPLTLVAKDTKWIVPVVLHSAQMASDLDYLNQLVKSVASHKVAIIGVCDRSRCGDALPPGQAPPGVPILAYGSYVPLMEIGHYDERNQVMLLDDHWAVKQLMSKPVSAEELAAQIQKVSGK